MDLREYVGVLRQRWRLIVACALLGLAIASTVSWRTTPQYRSTTRLFVNAANDPGGSNAYTGSLFTRERVKTYERFVDSPIVSRAVIDALRLDLTDSALASMISADAPLDTVLLNIHVTDTEPRRAQQIADEVAAQFSRLVGSIEQGQAGGASTVTLTVVRPADLPENPVLPRTKFNLGLGVAVGLALGVGSALARHTFDTRVKTPAELEERFKVPTLAVVAFDGGARQRPLIVHDEPRSRRAEAFRRLRTNLQFVDVDSRPRSIVITSAVPGEGKSTTTCNLAIALADAGIRVILLDGDLRRPAVADYLGIEGAVGLTNVLIGQVTLDDALQPWGQSGRLSVLPSGVLPPNPSELLGSRQMSELIGLLEQRALVLIDAPPLLPVTDAAILASGASGALMVIRAYSTRREQVSTALAALGSVGAHVFGAVLNMAPTRGPDAYSYGYGYYGKYYATREDVGSLPVVAMDRLVSPRSALRADDATSAALRTSAHETGRTASDQQGIPHPGPSGSVREVDGASPPLGSHDAASAAFLGAIQSTRRTDE